jgi:hypothetical protein
LVNRAAIFNPEIKELATAFADPDPEDILNLCLLRNSLFGGAQVRNSSNDQ